ncbi:MAG: thermonuclease family protein [Deltaproteobacteria bacterium]|nr:thermonuclease family protein [Deltaproteobacteria bacterium]
MIFRKTSLLVLMLTLISSSSWAWEGKCVAVISGDIIKVMHNGEAEYIRLYGIDCPDKGQAYWVDAKRFTANMVSGKNIDVLPVDKDNYGNTVAWIHAGGRNLNHYLAGTGLAWHDILTAPDNPELKKLQAEAREAKRGLWQHPKPVAPWVYRKTKK